MIVGTLEVSLRLEGCRSLKEKRSILRSLTERVRRDFQVAIAEVDDHDMWGNAVLGVACVSDNAVHAESVIQHVVDFFDGIAEVEVVGLDRRVERY